MVVISIINIKPIYSLYIISLLSNLLVSVMTITLAVYTNWMFLFNKIKSKFEIINNNVEQEKISLPIYYLENINSEIKSWNDFKKYMLDDYPAIIEEIERLEFLSKTEKLYAALFIFDISHKEIADLLCVSLRTVETNFYRLRTKLKENNRSFSYPYNSN
jgi:energy-coupling factor transporter transmembrane protein EcfT